MIGNVLKVIAALIIGYLIGFLCGGVLGILVGVIPSFLFREIFYSNQLMLTSILLSIILGGLLGYVEILIFNRLFDGNDKPLVGMSVGALIGLLAIFLGNYVLYSPTSIAFTPDLYTVAMIYSGVIGSEIGSTIFMIFGVVQTIREIVNSHKVIRSLN